MTRSKYTKLAWISALIAASLPWLSSIVVFGATGQTDRIFDTAETGIMLFNSLWAAAPFIVVALLSLRWSAADRTGWPLFHGIMLNIGMWAWLTFSAWEVQSTPEASGGANIVLLMLMLVLPIVTFVIVKAAEFLSQRKV